MFSRRWFTLTIETHGRSLNALSYLVGFKTCTTVRRWVPFEPVTKDNYKEYLEKL